METKFEINKIYTARSFCDYNSVWKYKVVKRTAKTVWIIDIDEKNAPTIMRKIKVYNNCEQMRPEGKNTPVLYAHNSQKPLINESPVDTWEKLVIKLDLSIDEQNHSGILSRMVEEEIKDFSDEETHRVFKECVGPSICKRVLNQYIKKGLTYALYNGVFNNSIESML